MHVAIKEIITRFVERKQSVCVWPFVFSFISLGLF